MESDKLERLLLQADNLLLKKDWAAVSVILENHRSSKEVVELIGEVMSQDIIIDKPERIGNPDFVTMMEQFRSIRRSQGYDTNLSSANSHSNRNLLFLLAMYTFMAYHYQRTPVAGSAVRTITDTEEFHAAVRILDQRRQKEDEQELKRFLYYGENMFPSRYVTLRYGLDDEFQTLREENTIWQSRMTAGEPYDYNNRRGLYEGLELKVENALEQIECFTPSHQYLAQRKEELDLLEMFARNPSSIQEDVLHIHVLSKHGICEDDSILERCRQVEKAYRELDRRMACLTGREPYADKLFESLKRKEPKPSQEQTPKGCRSCASHKEERHPEESQPQAPIRKMRR